MKDDKDTFNPFIERPGPKPYFEAKKFNGTIFDLADKWASELTEEDIAEFEKAINGEPPAGKVVGQLHPFVNARERLKGDGKIYTSAEILSHREGDE